VLRSVAPTPFQPPQPAQSKLAVAPWHTRAALSLAEQGNAEQLAREERLARGGAAFAVNTAAAESEAIPHTQWRRGPGVRAVAALVSERQWWQHAVRASLLA
jgi:hypothetical protein